MGFPFIDRDFLARIPSFWVGSDAVRNLRSVTEHMLKRILIEIDLEFRSRLVG